MKTKTMISKKYRPVILYYPVGLVHIQNMKRIQNILPEIHFIALCRISKPWFDSEEKLQALGVDYISVNEGLIDNTIFSRNVKGIILSIATPDVWVIDLMERADQRDIPVIAIEEVHQLAVTDNGMNNYLLPTDYLLVASPYERDGFIKRGHPSNRVLCAGWPFFPQRTSSGNKNLLKQIRNELGVEPGEKTATLILSCLNTIDSGSAETENVRINLIENSFKGMVPGYKLIIKGHPNEKPASIKSFVDKFAPGAMVLDPAYDVNPILAVTDLLISRGNSQVVIQALQKKNTNLRFP